MPKTFARPIDDIEVRILQIAASVSVDRPALLEDVLSWYKIAFHHRDVPAEYLGATLHAIEKTLELEMPSDAFALVREQLRAAMGSLESAPTEQPPRNLSGKADQAARTSGERQVDRCSPPAHRRGNRGHGPRKALR